MNEINEKNERNIYTELERNGEIEFKKKKRRRKNTHKNYYAYMEVNVSFRRKTIRLVTALEITEIAPYVRIYS